MWEGRHRSSLVQSEKYLLTCFRYIELNPVRADMVQRPEEYRWSSYGSNAWGDAGWITPHEEYLRLGRATHQRCAVYRELIRYHIEGNDLDLFRRAAHYCQPVGDGRFRQQVDEKYGLKGGQMKRWHPGKESRGKSGMINI